MPFTANLLHGAAVIGTITDLSGGALAGSGVTKPVPGVTAGWNSSTLANRYGKARENTEGAFVGNRARSALTASPPRSTAKPRGHRQHRHACCRVRQNRFGGTVTGPIFCDRSFFFLNSEVGKNIESSETRLTSVP